MIVCQVPNRKIRGEIRTISACEQLFEKGIEGAWEMHFVGPLIFCPLTYGKMAPFFLGKREGELDKLLKENGNKFFGSEKMVPIFCKP